MSTRTKWGFAGACLTVVGLFWGCGGALGSNSGGESHFLAYCDETCAEGLSCISGVCTRACVVDEDDCDDLHPDAQCSDSIEPGAVAVCDVACTNDEQCESLGANYACETGQCRGTTRVASSGSGGSGGVSSGGPGSSSTLSGESESSGGAGGTTNGGGSTGGAGGAGTSCEYLFQEFPDGTTFDNPSGCDGTCTCTEGKLECEEIADGRCADGVPVFACPAEIQSDPVEVRSAFFVKGSFIFDADVLRLEVAYGGGCTTHDFGLCYEPGLEPSASGAFLEGELRLIHDAHDDSCDLAPSHTLNFNLGPYAGYVMEERDVPGAVVETQFGLYAFGELSCDEAPSTANAQVVQAAEQTLNLGCRTDDDCEWAYPAVSCYSGCYEAITVEGQYAFADALEDVQVDVCEPYYAAGCPELPKPICDEPPELGCINGRCDRVLLQ